MASNDNIRRFDKKNDNEYHISYLWDRIPFVQQIEWHHLTPIDTIRLQGYFSAMLSKY
jgi:hypothetical protein